MLQGLEELLRSGVWDHAVLLSGADLALRSVDELAAALAEHRSTSLVSTFDGWKDHPSRAPAVQWVACVCLVKAIFVQWRMRRFYHFNTNFLEIVTH